MAHSIVASVSPSIPASRSEEDVAFETDVAVVTLQVFLEGVAGERSAFAPWMAMLGPKGDLNLPALWPAGDLEALKGTLVLEEVERCVAKAALERDMIAAAIDVGGAGWAHGKGEEGADEAGEFSEQHRWLDWGEMGGRPTQAEWLHARCTVQSRAYRVGSR